MDNNKSRAAYRMENLILNKNKNKMEVVKTYDIKANDKKNLYEYIGDKFGTDTAVPDSDEYTYKRIGKLTGTQTADLTKENGY
jgi:hypothetical protein